MPVASRLPQLIEPNMALIFTRDLGQLVVRTDALAVFTAVQTSPVWQAVREAVYHGVQRRNRSIARCFCVNASTVPRVTASTTITILLSNPERRNNVREITEELRAKRREAGRKGGKKSGRGGFGYLRDTDPERLREIARKGRATIKKGQQPSVDGEHEPR